MLHAATFGGTAPSVSELVLWLVPPPAAAYRQPHTSGQGAIARARAAACEAGYSAVCHTRCASPCVGAGDGGAISKCVDEAGSCPAVAPQYF
jgi:hypothetical protein